MLVKLFATGTGQAKSAIDYLLGDKDHTGKTRAVKPEILEGNPKITANLIDSCTREHKYNSGAIAFRDGEKPTSEQIEKVMASFEATFFAGLKKDKNFNILWIRHEDKGNTELHFLTPMTEISKKTRLNIHPPGKKNLEFFNSWVAVTNQQLGFAQVVPDPLKRALSAFEAKIPKGQKKAGKLESIHKILEQRIKNGSIQNRDQLCSFLESKNVTITRKGKDYISICAEGTKPVRLKGSIYSENSNYQQILVESSKAKSSKFLNKDEFLAVHSCLKTHIQNRQQFNAKCFLFKKVPRYMRTIEKSGTSKPVVAKDKPISVSKISTDFDKLSAISKIEAVKQEISGIKFPTHQASTTTSTDSPGPSIAPSGAFEAVQASLVSLGEIQASIDAAVADVATAKDPAKRAHAEHRLAALLANKARMEERLAQAKKREINSLKL